jgi:hypothetical protein
MSVMLFKNVSVRDFPPFFRSSVFTFLPPALSAGVLFPYSFVTVVQQGSLSLLRATGQGR